LTRRQIQRLDPAPSDFDRVARRRLGVQQGREQALLPGQLEAKEVS